MRRFTYEYVKEQFEREGYKLLSSKYVNSKTKLNYKCSKGHKHTITWSDWKSGRRCSICGLENRAAKRRLDFDIIEKSFSDEGYVLLTTKDEYRNVEQKLDFVCPNDHDHSMSYHNWKNGWRCTYCHHDKLSILFAGDGSVHWKGGISCEPYCDAWADKEYKESIKERDNYECQNPDCRKLDCILTIHHIDYNKQNCAPWNLITICKSCNSRANFNRNWHKDFYKSIVKEKYNYREV